MTGVQTCALPISQYNLGVIYYEGLGVAKSSRDALMWWTVAADKGHAPAQYNLGALYVLGIAGNKEEDVGIGLWKKAANQGYLEARQALSHAYAEGLFGLKKNPRKAKHWSIK